MLRTAFSRALTRAPGLFLGLAFLAPAASPLPVFLDTTSPGFAAAGARTLHYGDAYATLADGNRVTFDGTLIELVQDDGTLLQVLGTLPGTLQRYPSFVVPDPTGTYAVVGESTRGKLYRVDLSGGGVVALARLEFNFDAVFEDAGHVLISAAPCGFACGNEIYRMDTASGLLTLVASVSGPSGPVAISAAGDLYYGLIPDNFGAPGSILRWTSAQLASHTVLSEGAATVFVASLDPASSMEFDPVYGHLFVASPVFGATSHVLEYDAAGQLVGSVAQSPEYLANVELLRTSGIGSFQAFQPAGVELKYLATDFGAQTAEVRTVHTKRPRGFTSGPGLTGPGAVTFTVRGAHPNASFRVLAGHSALYNPQESTYDTGTYLFHTGIPPSDIRRLSILTTDANGEGSFTFQNTGLQGTLVLQALIRDPNGDFVGSSTEAFN